eukprot:1133982-Pelagomonas_calceolata.AAC.1
MEVSVTGIIFWLVATPKRNHCCLCNSMQDDEDGGISDRPDDMADIYHTFSGLAGLSLMGYPGLKAIDPTWALTSEVVARIKARNTSA